MTAPFVKQDGVIDLSDARKSGPQTSSVIGIPPKTYEEVCDTLQHEGRQYCYYAKDGRLFISKTHRFNPLVTGFAGRITRLKLPCFPQYVELEVIKKFRESEGSADSDRDASDMERCAKQLFERAVELRASDIHIRCVSSALTTIYMRIHGDLEFSEEHPAVYGERLCSAIYHSMAKVADTTFDPRSHQDARIADKQNLPSKIDGIRVATTPQVDGFLMVLRLLYNDTVEEYDLEPLGYSREQKASIDLMKRRPIGINIFAGPTGSGKSTTLQRALSSIIKETCGRRNVITVEDPPEYPIKGAVQTPVTNATSEEARLRAFADAIKAAMRLDPDILMIGEIRDYASAQLAFRAAMTGHQVWTTLHANSVFGILDRLLDIGIPLELLTDHTLITGLTCQRLVKVLCPECKKHISEVQNRYSPRDVARIMQACDLTTVFVTGDGCNACQHRGTHGRTVVAETIITDATLMEHIRQRNRIAAVDYWKTGQMGKSMLDHAIQKVNAGLVDPFAAEDVVGPLNLNVIESDHRINTTEVQSAVA